MLHKQQLLLAQICSKSKANNISQVEKIFLIGKMMRAGTIFKCTVVYVGNYPLWDSNVILAINLIELIIRSQMLLLKNQIRCRQSVPVSDFRWIIRMRLVISRHRSHLAQHNRALCWVTRLSNSILYGFTEFQLQKTRVLEDRDTLFYVFYFETLELEPLLFKQQHPSPLETGLWSLAIRCFIANISQSSVSSTTPLCLNKCNNLRQRRKEAAACTCVICSLQVRWNQLALLWWFLLKCQYHHMWSISSFSSLQSNVCGFIGVLWSNQTRAMGKRPN